MYQLIYPALFGVSALLYIMPTAASEKEPTQVQPLNSVVMQSRTTDWKQANQKVAELGGWQFYASEAGSHQGMDHSQHATDGTMDHSAHSQAMETSDTDIDHSKHHKHQQMDHKNPTSDDDIDHSKHHKHQQMDHKKTTSDADIDHSKHHKHQQMDHSGHPSPQQVHTGDEHEHHH